MVKKLTSMVIGILVAFLIYSTLLMSIPKAQLITNYKPTDTVGTYDEEQTEGQLDIRIPETYHISIKKAIDYRAAGVVIYNRKNPMWFWEHVEVEANTELGGGELATESNVTAESKENVKTQLGGLPVDSNYFEISSNYGTRTDPFTKEQSFHTGIDIAAPGILGASVKSVAKGKVTAVIKNSKTGEYEGYGNCVVIEHEGFSTLYGHMQSISNINEGDTVDIGDKIGTVGSTGRSTGPHLHFEVLINDRKVNPLPLLSDKFDGLPNQEPIKSPVNDIVKDPAKSDVQDKVQDPINLPMETDNQQTTPSDKFTEDVDVKEITEPLIDNETKKTETTEDARTESDIEYEIIEPSDKIKKFLQALDNTELDKDKLMKKTPHQEDN